MDERRILKTLQPPLSDTQVVQCLSWVMTDVYFTLPLGESSLSEERVRFGPPRPLPRPTLPQAGE